MTLNENTMRLLESKIYGIVKTALREADESDKDSKEIKKKYKAIQTALDDPKRNPTQIMAKALGFSPDDDSERSYAFKKLHQTDNDETGKPYSFNKDEINKIFAALNA